MTIEVSGGAGGMGAVYQDLLAQAGILDDAGDEVRRWSDDVAKVAFDDSVLAAALLCPVEAAAVGIAVGVATTSLLTVSTTLEATALVLQASVETYQFFDAAQQAAMEALHQVGGYALGMALPGLLASGALLLATNPVLTGTLALMIARDPDAVMNGAMETLFENPWLMEELTKTAPWLIQGLASQLPGGPLLPYLLSGGSWPTTDYEQAVGGLVSVGNLFGAFQDEGDFEVQSVGAGDGAAPTSVAEIFEQQSMLGKDANHGQIQVTRVVDADGNESFIVQIPGTQEWSPARGDNPVDLTTNVQLMSGQQTLLQEQVAQAMRDAGVDPGEPVMLTGHSQGGIACASMASDPSFTREFTVRSIVTGGSPIARFDIPPDVSVLALEHDQDPVPMLEGRENPDRPNWVTVERDVSGVEGLHGPGDAHGTGVYQSTGAQVDSSNDPSIRAWQEQNERFFTGDATVDRYQITPSAP
ncbi:hypothetical protein [Actinotalea subterranea]|uniref:hypothetical protein n=1 Tax=Actinotalea subterranea TaxID=2607497 RepID=UPI0011ED4EB1|nr:hypothetical protein [Actinotalea subterranea]